MAKKVAKTAKTMAEIWIISGNPPTVFPQSVPLDSNGSKHPAEVYWQAVDPTITYQIAFSNSPFKKPGPFQTGTDGSTAVETVDPGANDGQFLYTITQIAPSITAMKLPGSGIIIEDS